MNGFSPKKKASHSRRLTIEEGNHPCAEDKPSVHYQQASPRRSSITHSISPSAPSQGSRSHSARTAARQDAPADDVLGYSTVSFLTVPQTPLRRPSTADVMIEKLHVSILIYVSWH